MDEEAKLLKNPDEKHAFDESHEQNRKLDLVHKEIVIVQDTEHLEEPECQIDPKLRKIYQVPTHEVV